MPQVTSSSAMEDYNPHGIAMTNCLDYPEFMSWAGKVLIN
jgi:hypothetical protein